MLEKRKCPATSCLGRKHGVCSDYRSSARESERRHPIHTALDHISILSLPEKITRVAAGSDAMQIEWHDNTVFIKPLKADNPPISWCGPNTRCPLMSWRRREMSNPCRR